jgi:4-aminobutyrate aminotransferase-like enzyme
MIISEPRPPRRRLSAEDPPTPESLEEIIARRRKVMGEKLYVFYDPPLHIVKGEGVWLRHPTAAAISTATTTCRMWAIATLTSPRPSPGRRGRSTPTRATSPTSRSNMPSAWERLCSDGLSAVVFVNSGSEANDLAWRMAKAWTGKQGGLAMDFAYHGVSEAIDAFSPSNSPAHWYAPHIRLLPSPDVYRGAFGPTIPIPGERYAAMADPLIADLDGEGLWRCRR